MAKYSNPDVLDAALNLVATATDMHACSAQPTDFANVATVSLAETPMAGGDYTLLDSPSSGRRLTMAEKGGVSVAAAGTVTHVALVDTANSKLLYVTTTDNQELTSGSFVDFPEWSIDIADPT